MFALGDKSIKFPEDVLMSFLDRYEWESYFYAIAPVFVRDELTAESRRKLHPRMRDYANAWMGKKPVRSMNTKIRRLTLSRTHIIGKEAAGSRMRLEDASRIQTNQSLDNTSVER